MALPEMEWKHLSIKATVSRARQWGYMKKMSGASGARICGIHPRDKLAQEHASFDEIKNVPWHVIMSRDLLINRYPLD